MRRTFFLTFLSLLTISSGVTSASAEEIGSVGYRFKWLGPNDKIVIEAFDDPEVPGVTCYMSHARTGGIKGAIGLAEDPGEA
ncbi:CreA family protein, partial [Salmonella enterica]|uniref:CreA family protein n=1 Tax=Salmonella enterica TaxID=28901 RepID=UPI003CF199F4